MRYLIGLLLIVFFAAIGLFAVQNTQPIEIKFWNWDLKAPVALVSIATYFLGMLSGWSVVAFLTSSIRRVRAESHHHHEAQV